jgi:hypothetical protein
MLGQKLIAALVGLALAAPAVHAGWAEAMFDEQSCDFGAVPRGLVMTHHFRIKNNTGKRVTIGNVRVSCGCTQAQALKTRLEAGEETSVVAQMDTGRFSNSRTVTVFVRLDEPQYEEVSLKVVANSREDLAISPSPLDLGQVKSGDGTTKSAKVVFYSASPEITECTSESTYVQPSVKEVKRGDGSVEYQVTVKLRNDIPAGKWYTSVSMKTNNPAMPRITLPITVEVTK